MVPRAPRVMVIGLDCAAPELVFDQFAGQLPNLDRLRSRGTYGRLESVIPPITVPAWACVTTGRDPGRLGIYGFRNRTGFGYQDWGIADSTWLREPHIWDYLGQAGGDSVIVGVPPGFPPRPIQGCQVGCFLTPSTQGQRAWTYPESLAAEIHQLTGGYQADVANFRTDDKPRLLAEIFRQSDQQFSVALHLAKTRPWRLLMLVNIALDRMHHAFWSCFDTRHRRFAPGNPYAGEMLRFYERMDQRIGELLEVAGDETAVLVVSDHGAKRIDGGIAINQWLMDQGLLSLKQKPTAPTPFSQLEVDWDRTKAWSEGGYYARVFINLRGREPRGIVPREDYENFRGELAAAIRQIPDDQGRAMETQVYTPEELYPEVRGVPPDLLVLFGDLHWRSIGSVGHASIAVLDNDTGPDDANHAQHGLYILAGPNIRSSGPTDRSLLDVAPTVLELLALPTPTGLSPHRLTR